MNKSNLAFYVSKITIKRHVLKTTFNYFTKICYDILYNILILEKYFINSSFINNYNFFF